MGQTGKSRLMCLLADSLPEAAPDCYPQQSGVTQLQFFLQEKSCFIPARSIP